MDVIKYSLMVVLLVSPLCFSKDLEGLNISFSGEVIGIYEKVKPDFLKLIKSESNSEDEIGDYLSKIENYKIQVIEEKDVYWIYFTPVRPKGLILKGGGASYKLRKNDLHILEKKYYE